ncbi:putative mitochondrial processing peptidase alpha subunit protein [Botrytis fragariae]|uniref:Alpha-MPP n=1 Tax=Botrytis fragariae TaxID=1964551 RepID=A0A8H6B4Z8_9HELO|nr:putative mitochondrial processing peptidase alpha subunit protein [Botrytis fragariae]KAF5879185.1 putative mitochondrial processing peptidase alpha subunit protein [Botrytis fragariae]
MLRNPSTRVLRRALSSQRPISNVLPAFRSRSLATVVEPIQKDPAELDQITTLPNGVRVATEALPGHFSGIGVYIDAGSRYENEDLRGVSHIMDRLAFKSTSKRSSDEIESLMYQSATFNSAVPTTVALLAETIRNPLITEEEVSQQLVTAEYEIGEIWSKPELILPEIVHMVAYKGNTLGNPLLCPKERLSEINSHTIQQYRDTFYRPERMVHFGDMPKSAPILSQTGSETSLDSLSGETSSDSSISSSSSSTPPSPTQKPSTLISRMPFFKNISTSAPKNASVQNGFLNPLNLHEPSRYTGGFLALPTLPPPVNPALPALSHIHIAFEALPISSPDIYALATLQTLLGGGGSFSAGGPGKGMYSRLYTNVLNQHGWVESCMAFNHSYTDSGLFGISSSCSPGYVKNMLDVMCRELQSLTLDSGFSALQTAEVNRAKNQLRSSLLMNLESRMVELEDLGRQVQVHGRKVGVREMCKKIEELTVKDLRRVATQVFGGLVKNAGEGSGSPTVVLQEGEEEGRVYKNFSWDDIQDRIHGWKLGSW